MTSAERAFYYCQAICANKQFEAAKPLSREMSYGRRALERKSPEDAAVEETCTESAGAACGGVSPWLGSAYGGVSPWLGSARAWGRSAVGSAHAWGQPVVGVILW